jgi:hypothetical protein
MKNVIIAAAMSVCIASISSADTLVLRNGTRVQGTVVGIAGSTVTFKLANGATRRYPTSQVQSVEFVSPERANARAGRSRQQLEVPAGTELIVRTVETIDSRNSRPDQVFSAIVEEDVYDDSRRILIPERASAQLVIREMTSGGQTGSPEMMLDLQSITVAGRRYLVSTNDVAMDNETGIGRNRRTAETVGAGAALGSIIGAIAGGGKGAAIGVLVGAAGGAGVQVLTRGRDVQVPSETALTFRLDRAVTLEADY